MVKRVWSLGIFVAIVILVATVSAQEARKLETIEIAQPVDISKIVNLIVNWRIWVVLIIAAGFGALGGLARKLTSPSENKTSWRDVVVGPVASLAVLLVFTPPDLVKFIALSIVAGYGGKAVLNAMGARVEAALAIQNGTEAVATGKEVAKNAKELLVRNMVQTEQQPREHVLETLMTFVPPAEIATKPLGDIQNELRLLDAKLTWLERSLQR